MASVYLSPSTQEYNVYYDGVGNEEYYMNLIADDLQAGLTSSGVEVFRNSPKMTASQSASQSNQNDHSLHLAIHSNAAGSGNAGTVRGVDVYYYATSEKGKRAAEIIAKNFKSIYPDPSRVRTLPNTTFAELRRTRAPAVLIEVGYHDNAEDAEWIRSNIGLIAANLSTSVLEFLGKSTSQTGRVTTAGSRLNIRKGPSTDTEIIGKIPNGGVMTIIENKGDWLLVNYGGVTGYVYAYYVTID